MTDYELRRTINALETFAGENSFFRSLVPALRKADPNNKEILIEAFRKMNRSEHYLPGGFHYEDTIPTFTLEEVTPKTSLETCQEKSNEWVKKTLGIKV